MCHHCVKHPVPRFFRLPRTLPRWPHSAFRLKEGAPLLPPVALTAGPTRLFREVDPSFTHTAAQF